MPQKCILSGVSNISFQMKCWISLNKKLTNENFVDAYVFLKSKLHQKIFILNTRKLCMREERILECM